MFENKSAESLTALKTQIRNKIEKAGPGVDIPYWEGLLQQLHSFEAKARLTERHDAHLKRKFGDIYEDETARAEADLAVLKHRMTTLANTSSVNESNTEREMRQKLEKERKMKRKIRVKELHDPWKI